MFKEVKAYKCECSGCSEAVTTDGVIDIFEDKDVLLTIAMQYGYTYHMGEWFCHECKINKEGVKVDLGGSYTLSEGATNGLLKIRVNLSADGKAEVVETKNLDFKKP